MLAINCLPKRAFRPLGKGTKTKPDADLQYPSHPPPHTHTWANTHLLLVVSPLWFIHREVEGSAKPNSSYSAAKQFLQQPRRHMATN